MTLDVNNGTAAGLRIQLIEGERQFEVSRKYVSSKTKHTPHLDTAVDSRNQHTRSTGLTSSHIQRPLHIGRRPSRDAIVDEQGLRDERTLGMRDILAKRKTANPLDEMHTSKPMSKPQLPYTLKSCSLAPRLALLDCVFLLLQPTFDLRRGRLQTDRKTPNTN